MSRPMRDPDASQISHQLVTANQRPSARRLPSGAWGRLRAAPIDALETYGLPSKGETRLSDAKAQENYFKKIVERYMRFCASTGAEKLEHAFASLNLKGIEPLKRSSGKDVSIQAAASGASTQTAANPETRVSDTAPLSSAPAILPSKEPVSEAQKAELSTIVQAMRKLREAVVSTSRTDAFAQRAYMFIIHATILTSHWESYSPALLYLLQKIHPVTPLSQPERQEMVEYLVLDLACRQGDLGEAFKVRWRYRLRDRKVERVLRCLVHDDWVGFWRVRRAVDGYARALMGWVEDGVRVHALKCLGRTYLSVERRFLEKSTERTWDELVSMGVGWELEGDQIRIRKIKGR